jgi:hypothetical protein
MFYYDPSSVGNILKSPLPALSYLMQLKSAITSFPKELFYISTGNQDKADDNHAIKKALQVLPIGSEAIRLLPLFSSETAKDLGIKQASNNGFFQ